MLALGLEYICDALRDLLPFIQFKKREKHPWRSFTFSKVAAKGHGGMVKLFRGCFSRFLNCKNGTKSQKVSHIEIKNRFLKQEYLH